MRQNIFKLVIFDLDGTLVDTLSDIADSANSVLKHFKIKKASKEKVKYAVGSGVDKFFVELAVQSNDIPAAQKLFIKYYLKNLTVKSGLYPGIRDVLRTFKRQKRIMYVVSNKPKLPSQKLLTALGVNKYFRKIIGINSEDKKRLKPSPYYPKKLLKKEHIKPENAIIIGDSKADILAAKNAGIYSCAVLYGFRQYKELKKYKPDFFIKKPIELLKVIN